MPVLSDFFSILIDEAVFAIEAVEVVAGVEMFPVRNEVFGGLVSHLLVFCISVTNLLPQEHLISVKGKKMNTRSYN